MNTVSAKIWKTGQILFIGLLAATPAMAMRGGPGNEGRGPEFRGHPSAFHGNACFEKRRMGDPGLHLIQMGKRLELTSAQEMKILKLSQKFRAEIQANRETAKPVHEKLKALRDSKTFDEKAMRSALNEVQPLKVEGMILHAKYRDEIRKILTEEQQAEIEKCHEKGKKHFKSGRGEKRVKKRRNNSAPASGNTGVE